MNAGKFRVDAAAIKYVEKVARLRTPGLITFAGLFGLQIVLTARWDWRLAWIPPAAVVAMIGWFVIGGLIGRAKWPRMSHLWTVVHAYLLPQNEVANGQIAKKHWQLPMFAILILLAIPGWLGLLAALFVVVVIILIPASKRLVAGQLIFGLLGIALLVLLGAIFGRNGLGWIPGVSGALGLAVGALIAFIWMLSTHHGKAGRSWVLQPEGFAMLFAFLPLCLFVFGSGVAAVLVFIVVCIVLPAFYLSYLVIRLIDEGAKVRRNLEPGSLRAQLQPRNLSGAEDPIRESDGFFRLCAPQYVKVEPTQAEPKVGAKGVLAWVGGVGDATIPGDVSEYLVFRNMGVVDAMSFDLPDHVTQQVRTALAEKLSVSFLHRGMRNMSPRHTRFLSQRCRGSTMKSYCFQYNGQAPCRTHLAQACTMQKAYLATLIAWMFALMLRGK
jgi:hypothetical protein